MSKNITPSSFKEAYNFSNSNFLHSHNYLNPLHSHNTKNSIIQTNETMAQNNQFIQEQIRIAKSDSKISIPKQIPTVPLKNQFDIVELVQQNKAKQNAKLKLDSDRKFQQLHIQKVREDVSHYYDQPKCQTSRDSRTAYRSRRDFSTAKSHQSIKLLDMQQYSKIEEALKHELKELQSSAPSSRVQSIKLKEWFHNQKQEDAMGVLAVTVQELVRQTKKDCIERGQLLEDVWRKIQQVLANHKFQAEVQMHQNEIQTLADYGRVHDLYKHQLGELQETCRNLKAKLEIESNEHLITKKDFKEIEENYKKSRNQLNDIRKVSHFLQKKVKQQNYEIDQLNKKLASHNSIKTNRKRQDSWKSPGVVQPSFSDSDSDQDLMDGLLDDKNIVEMNNMVMNMDKIVKVACAETQTDENFKRQFARSIETQTNLNLCNKDMNLILDSQQKLEQVLLQFKARCSVEQSLKLIDEKTIQQQQMDAFIEQRFAINEPSDDLSLNSLGHRSNKGSGQFLQINFDPRAIQSSYDVLQEPQVFQPKEKEKKVDFERVKVLLVMVQDQEEKIKDLQMIIEQMTLQCQIHLNQLEEAKLRSISLNTQQQFKDAKSQIRLEQEKLEQYLSSENLSPSEKNIKMKQREQREQKDNKKVQHKFQFKGPQLGQRVTVVYDFQKSNAGPQLIEKIKQKQLPKIKHFMPLKLLLKQITVIYQDRISQQKENQQIKDQDMASFVYSYFLSQFGIKKIAEQKFLILVVSVKHHKQIVRVNVFAKFLGLFDQYVNYSIDEMKKYLEAFDYVTNVSQLGATLPDQESEIRYLVPYLRAVQYIGMFADSRMTVEEKDELKKEVELLKELDSKRQANIDFDQFMIQMFVKYKILVSRAKEYVINAFAACDLDGNNMCNFEEWYLLIRHIEPDRLSHDQISEIFFTNADLLVKGEQNFSFEKFAVICVEYGLFSEEAQNNFLQTKGTKTEIMVQFGKLLDQWPNIRKKIESQFDQITLLDAERLDHWREIIETLENKLLEFKNHLSQAGIEKKVKPLLIANLLLQREAAMLLDLQKEYQDENQEVSMAKSRHSIELIDDEIKETKG